MNKPLIVSIGTAVPQYKVSQEDHYNFVLTSSNVSETDQVRLQKIYNSSGIDSRYSVLDNFSSTQTSDFFSGKGPTTAQRMSIYKKHALKLSIDAANDCLNRIEDFDKKEITHVISFSCTGMYAPGLDIELIRELELNLNVERTCINFMGCYAAFNAIKSANYIVKAQPDAKVLLVGTELCSIHYRNAREMDQWVANAIFGDGAAAVLITGKGFNNENVSLSLNAFYSEFCPAESDKMVWDVGDFGFNLKLSAYVPVIVEKGIGALTEKLFSCMNLQSDQEVDYAIHPGGKAILKACEKALCIDIAKNRFSYDVLRDYGNMSSVTVLFVLQKHLQSLNKSDKGKRILSCAFGPGITIESMMLEVV